MVDGAHSQHMTEDSIVGWLIEGMSFGKALHYSTPLCLAPAVFQKIHSLLFPDLTKMNISGNEVLIQPNVAAMWRTVA